MTENRRTRDRFSRVRRFFAGILSRQGETEGVLGNGLGGRRLGLGLLRGLVELAGAGVEGQIQREIFARTEDGEWELVSWGY